MKARTPVRVLKLKKYFEGVMMDERAPARLRMTAAERLCELFIEVERGKREREIAVARAQARLEQAASERTAQTTLEMPQGDSEPEPIAKAEREGKDALDSFLGKLKTQQLGKVEGALST